MTDKFAARISGYDWVTGDYGERLAVFWACGNHITQLLEPTLHDLGNAIADHLDECEECQ